MINEELKRITVASLLVAISVVLGVIFKTVVPAGLNFGFPYYAIPLVIGSLILGPLYGGMMGLISDYLGFIILPVGEYDVIFALRAIMWGVIPWFFATYKSKWYKVLLSVFVAHVFATLSSTFSNFLYQYILTNDFNTSIVIATGNLGLRVLMLPVNVIIMTALVHTINFRMVNIYETYLNLEDKKS
ncbi:MAG: folate family ECF transporter S component [Acholeplasmataceae bacterium]